MIKQVHQTVRTLAGATLAMTAAFSAILTYMQLKQPDAPVMVEGGKEIPAEGVKCLIEWKYDGRKTAIRGFRVLRRLSSQDSVGVFRGIAETSLAMRSYEDRCPDDRKCVYRVVTVNLFGVDSPHSRFLDCVKS